MTFPLCHLLYEEFPRDPRVRRYVNALNSTGKYCVIICSKKKHDKFFENWKGNSVYRIPITKHRQSFFLTALEYSFFTFLSSVLLFFLWLKFRFKTIHVHTLPDFLVFAAVPEKIFGTKIILDLHELFPELFIARKPRLANSFWVKILKFIEKISIKFANVILTIHDPAREIFISRNPGIENKIHVVMNSVDPSEIAGKEKIETNDFIIIYNGTVVKLLNIPIIVNALAYLKDEMPLQDFNKIIFKIYGDGPALDEILSLATEKNLQNQVSYDGFIPPDKIYDEIVKAGVCILPPLKNIYSDLFYTVKLVEMIYLKIPVIASRLNTYKRYYSENALFYFDSGNTQQLAEKIKEVFYNKDLVRSKTETAYQEYQKVGWDIMKERYLKIIKSYLCSLI